MSLLNNRYWIIRPRRGTDAELAAYSGLLYEGELAYATDTKELWIGDDTGAPVLVTGSGGGVGPYLELAEIAAPAAPAANTGRLFFQDNGAGKTQLAVRFPTGAVQVIATEP